LEARTKIRTRTCVRKYEYEQISKFQTLTAT